MFGDLGSFVQTALGFVTIVCLAGVGLQRTRVNNLLVRLDDYEKEVEEKDRRDAERGVVIARLEAQAQAQAIKIEGLGEQVRGESYWQAFGVKLEDASTKLDHHNLEARAHWRADETKLDEIRDALRERP